MNESWGYVTKIVGEKGLQILIGDESEAEKNSIVVWVSLEKAIKLFEAIPRPQELYNQYMLQRDLTFLKANEVKKYLSKR